MRISRKPLYFSSVPLRFAPRGRWRLPALLILGGFLAVAGGLIGPGLGREAAVLSGSAAPLAAISARNGLSIENRPVDPVVVEQPSVPTAPRVVDPGPGPAFTGLTRLRVTGSDIGLVLRAGPGVEMARIGLVSDGAELIALGAPVSAGEYLWWPVRTRDGDEGWVAGSFTEALP